MQSDEHITNLNIDLIVPNANQPRKTFNEDSLNELSLSIKEYGILNPILVRKKDNLYEIIAGERRYRAAKKIGLKEVPVIIKTINDNKVTEIALIENLQRENISPIEEAKSLQEILKLSNITEKELSNMIGKSQPFISNKLRLLTLPVSIQDALINKKISERHARSLMTIKDEKKQEELLNKIVQEKLTVKDLDNIINEKTKTEEELASSINNNIESLKVSDEPQPKEKEEKESDTMNNGNFFPNMNNQDSNANMSLNSINMQTMNNNPPAPPKPPMLSFEPDQNAAPSQIESPAYTEQTPSVNVMPETGVMPQTVEPTPSPIPTFDFGQTVQVPSGATQVMDNTQEMTSAVPNFEMAAPQVETPAPMSVEQNVGMSTQMMDPPLFGPSIEPTVGLDLSMPTPTPTPAPQAAPQSFEVPVTTVPEPTQNKLAQVEEFLNTNGINYKLYSNDSNHCIIIEL